MTHTLPSNGSGAAKGDWGKALAVLFITLLSILFLYRDTALSMVEIWSRSETFTHGFLVPPISLWLIWRIRKDLAQVSLRPNAWFLLVPVGAGFFWLLAELAAVGVVAQFALVTMLVFSVPAVFGLPVARRILFPLAFLFFAVPFGEFAMPFFMDWTAKITVVGLRMSGIPVYREGLQFVIPSGNWSVVEACSGIRYLIASVTVGTLFAYLNYTSLNRRLLFVAVSFVVPIIANWVRAYLIVMLGHLSGNKLAAGVDHLIYGWVFFGIVIMAMFWVGARWREDELPPRIGGDTAAVGSQGAHSALPVLFSGIAFFLTSLIWPIAEWKIGSNLPPQVIRVEPLAPVAGWNASENTLADWMPHFENPSASLQSSYASEGRQVGLHIAYYRNQGHGRKMVSSNNVLVVSKDPQWNRVAGGNRQAMWSADAVTVRTAELVSANSTYSQRLVVWQLYWINGHLTASDVKAKAYTALMRLLGQGDDSAALFFYAPKESVAGGHKAIEDFVQAAAPVVMDALHRTRENR